MAMALVWKNSIGGNAAIHRTATQATTCLLQQLTRAYTSSLSISEKKRGKQEGPGYIDVKKLDVELSNVFGRFSADYDKNRPSYPQLGVQFAVNAVSEASTSHTVTCADIACGSGKASLLYARQNNVEKVICVDHDRLMLQECERQAKKERDSVMEKIETRIGLAEKLPIESHSIDMITVHQAFHWFEADAALSEFHRCLKSNGWLIAAWNDRDLGVEWIRELETLIEDANPKYHRDFKQSDQFAPVLTAGGFFKLVAKMSFPFTVEYHHEDEVIE